VTSLRPTATAVWTVDTVTDDDRREFERLVADDPFVNAVVASRLAAYRTLEPIRFGGVVLGARADKLTAAAFHGGNLLPVGGEQQSWDALAHHLAELPRICTSIVGRAGTIAAMWPVLEPAWGSARAIRTDQPLLVLERGEQRTRPDPRVRVMRPVDIERYLPAAAAMFTEELGISPFVGASGPSYRRRVESMLATGRAFGIVDEDGRMAFKADIGALTAQTCQVQGVWVRPDIRGRGLGTAGLAGVLEYALRLAPTASLYVNDFNTAARRMYARLGMRHVASLATVLF
jgi:predicted GNAT family acetyltransferase